MLSLKAQMVMAEMKPCAFCVWATHDFPNDDEHNGLHDCGWHTCGLDGVFRQCNSDCKNFVIADGAWASF